MDNSAPDNRHILLVSNDSFIEGLVRGYCLAHRLGLEVRRLTTGVTREQTGTPSRLIIVDSRSSGQSLDGQSAACPETMYALTRQTHTPLCVISDSPDKLAGQLLSEQGCVIGEPLAEQLGQCLRKYTGQNWHASSERRRQDRREWRDRRRDALESTRTAAAPPDPGGYSVGPFAIDPASLEVTMNKRGLYLSTKEFQLFQLLASNADRVLRAEAIILELWPENSRANKSDLYQYIHLLRRKIELDPQCPQWLVTVKGVGYRLCTQPAASSLPRRANQ